MRRIAEAVPGAVAELLRQAPLSPGKVAFAWRAAVGSQLERVTSVRLNGHVLTVAAPTREWAREIHRSSPVIQRRLDALLGDGIVTSLDVKVTPGSHQSLVPNP
jgi:predicted nucleic acid-binding Zn ribbon protein